MLLYFGEHWSSIENWNDDNISKQICPVKYEVSFVVSREETLRKLLQNKGWSSSCYLNEVHWKFFIILVGRRIHTLRMHQTIFFWIDECENSFLPLRREGAYYLYILHKQIIMDTDILCMHLCIYERICAVNNENSKMFIIPDKDNCLSLPNSRCLWTVYN